MASPTPETSTAVEFDLFSSLQYSPTLKSSPENTAICGKPCPYYMLDYHRDRVLQAAHNFGWQEAVTVLEASNSLDLIQEKCFDAVDGVLGTVEDRDAVAVRLRIVISPSGALTAEANLISQVPLTSLFPTSLTPPESLTPWSVYLDTIPTPPTDLTRYKTTSRTHYNDSRVRTSINSFFETKEVILWNPEGWVMEGSITNVYFYREEKGGWITPSTPMDDFTGQGKGKGGTAGTVRRWLIEKGMVRVGDLKKSEVRVGEVVWLSNGVKGLVLGKIVSV
ncbi:hypothetical protein TWF506_010381 [Arthrobotrys conoides]|uniref:Aminodeoxychorismate lyase n=1 Tax=Arthrobotrys conoides TaxID=74498 RepID=A0AAN8N8J5_9PEZI